MQAVDQHLVREVSRSFSISLRLLPGPMREPVSLAYLLARASDTIADTADVAAEERVLLLEGFMAEMEGGDGSWRSDLARFSEKQDHPGERRLIQRLSDCFRMLDALPPEPQRIIREVVAVITSGQRLDVERFAQGRGKLGSDEQLEDYCWRVAGCVGAFWTRIGFETLGERFSRHDPAELEASGIAYGKGLQLVNILRDLPEDLADGRCYLPVAEPEDREALLLEAAKWRRRSRDWLGEGLNYGSALGLRRLKAASVLPALLGVKTLDLLDQADWAQLSAGVKVGRSVVRRSFVRALFW